MEDESKPAASTEQSTESPKRPWPPNQDILAANKWKPGQSGNPSGRAKRKPITDGLLAFADKKIPGDKQGRTFRDAMIEKMFSMALKGDLRTMQEVIDRIEGGVVRGTEVSGPNGGPIEYAHKTPEEMKARLAELLAKGGLD